MRLRSYEQEPVGFIQNRLSVAQQRMLKIENKRIPTFPIYEDIGGNPPPGIEGQVAFSNTDLKVWWFSNGAWHTCPEGVPVIPCPGLWQQGGGPPTSATILDTGIGYPTAGIYAHNFIGDYGEIYADYYWQSYAMDAVSDTINGPYIAPHGVAVWNRSYSHSAFVGMLEHNYYSESNFPFVTGPREFRGCASSVGDDLNATTIEYTLGPIAENFVKFPIGDTYHIEFHVKFLGNRQWTYDMYVDGVFVNSAIATLQESDPFSTNGKVNTIGFTTNASYIFLPNVTDASSNNILGIPFPEFNTSGWYVIDADTFSVL